MCPETAYSYRLFLLFTYSHRRRGIGTMLRHDSCKKLETNMRIKFLGLLGVATLVLASGCNNAKSPDAAAKDIEAAQVTASKEVADAKHDEQKDLSSDAYQVAVAKADGDHKVAVEKCEMLQGHDQRVCKDQADADYDAAKANAKATKAAQTP